MILGSQIQQVSLLNEAWPKIVKTEAHQFKFTFFFFAYLIKFIVLKKSKFKAYNKLVINTGITVKGQKFRYC